MAQDEEVGLTKIGGNVTTPPKVAKEVIGRSKDEPTKKFITNQPQYTSMTETIESLDKRVSDIEARIDIVVNSLSIILQQFNTIEHKNTEKCDLLQRNSEILRNDVEYLEAGEIY